MDGSQWEDQRTPEERLRWWGSCSVREQGSSLAKHVQVTGSLSSTSQARQVNSRQSQSTTVRTHQAERLAAVGLEAQQPDRKGTMDNSR